MQTDQNDLAAHYSKLPSIPSDIKISQNAVMKPIAEIAQQLGIKDDDLEQFGKYKAKVENNVWESVKDRPDGKLILVTAVTPTPAGEGKTCTSIGLAQAFGQLGVKHALALREPSMGPTFGIKGGAAGGGFSQVLPMEDINMHFTGDLHAIAAAHNLLSAVLDNSMHFDNPLEIDPEKVTWRRTIDLCDRQLRNGEIGLGSKFDGFPHKTGFDIVAASEVMTIMALALDIDDLRERLGRIVVAYNTSGNPVFARELNCIGSLCVILKDALKPNIVQTCEHTPVFVHCGPFGNIAHGSNSVSATRLALKLAPYVITEAGFAADLGAEKFINIKCRQAGLKPNGAVLVATVRALKFHGGVEKEDLTTENLEALKTGCENLRTHAENVQKYGLPLVVAINRFPTDTAAELEIVRKFCEDMGVQSSLSEVVARGGKGGLDLAEKIKKIVDETPGTPNFYYNTSDPVKSKIETIAKEIYRADGVDYTEEAEKSIKILAENGLSDWPICMAKTQASLSDDPKKRNAPRGWRLQVRDVKVSNGAGFIVALTGKMMLMPGMPRESAVQKIDIDSNGRITGLS
jgi:formate--tetrahydrofolate ligase|tara:strand:+ start:151 stop:1872 length:1722 start_codon:yes stop_codon:yes gene_type:complete